MRIIALGVVILAFCIGAVSIGITPGPIVALVAGETSSFARRVCARIVNLLAEPLLLLLVRGALVIVFALFDFLVVKEGS